MQRNTECQKRPGDITNHVLTYTFGSNDMTEHWNRLPASPAGPTPTPTSILSQRYKLIQGNETYDSDAS